MTQRARARTCARMNAWCRHAASQTPETPQLLHQSMPAAAVLLAMLVPLVEPLGLPAPGAGGKWGAPGTLLGYECTLLATVAIIVSAVLG